MQSIALERKASTTSTTMSKDGHTVYVSFHALYQKKGRKKKLAGGFRLGSSASDDTPV